MKFIFAVLLFALAHPLLAADDINIDISNPMTTVVKHAMQQRVSRLVKFYQAGIIGLKNNGDIAIREGSRELNLPQRQIAEKLIDLENSERMALIAAIAKAHKRDDAMPEIRSRLAQRWMNELKPGYWYQDNQGNWAQKP
jgi:hypothetical protein